MRMTMRMAAAAMAVAIAFGGTGLRAQPSAPRQALERAIHQGMPYAEARRILLAAGWRPVASRPPCLNQVTPALCAALPEVTSTSSGPIAYVEMALRHAGSGTTVTVLASGDIAAWNRPGEEAGFTVERLSFR